MTTPALIFAAGGLCLLVYCVLLRRLLPRQRVPTHYQLLAWLGILTMAGAMCFAMAVYLIDR